MDSYFFAGFHRRLSLRLSVILIREVLQSLHMVVLHIQYRHKVLENLLLDLYSKDHLHQFLTLHLVQLREL